MFKQAVLVAALVAVGVNADCYMHNPAGSNCRLNEANTNRNNGNRLFDTQNNAKGGYCWGPSMSYYEGSQLTIEWTNQHGCGNPKLVCNLVLQYMCGFTEEEDAANQIRDGQTTNTIPNDANTYNEIDDASGEYLYGMHENYYYYQECANRNRNKGLFLADRELENNVGQRATATRQNNNGNRRGFECAEERDYYPYWHPTPWRDIAILAHSEKQCKWFQENSENVLGRGHCAPKVEDGGAPTFNQYDTETECLANGETWVVEEAHGIDAPECVLAPWNRHNHLGNGVNGFTNSYNWTLPTAKDLECIDDGCNCVLRIRYNISTGDYNGWDDSHTRNKGDGKDDFADSTMNKGNSPVIDDPYVPLVADEEERNISLALDTTQFGRTFQDRSHVFHIKPRPDGLLDSARIYNLNVRGKRGNIVQTYPAVEYDFVPQHLEVRVGDYVHFQIQGCDTNPAGNAGEGTDQTDRSDFTQIPFLDASYPVTDEWLTKNKDKRLFDDNALANHMSYLGQTDCLTYKQLLEKHNDNNNDIEQDEQNCMKLNSASQYFDGGLIRMNRTGDFAYMSHRNNNFSNRGQKGILVVSSMLDLWAIIVIAVAGVLFLGTGTVAAGTWYAGKNPNSAVGSFFSKLSPRA